MPSNAVKDFLQKNFWQISAVAVSLISLYVASIVKPLADSIKALAEENDKQELHIEAILKEGTVPSQLNGLRIEKVEENIIEIKQSLVRIEDKMDDIGNK